jgi:phosphodiesterase/alkaline phosphatase D-like protein
MIWALTLGCSGVGGVGGAAMAQPVVVTHGPMLGHVRHDSVRVWGRTSRAGQYRVRYGVEPGRLNQTSKPVATTLEHDFTGVLVLEGLQENTRYYYELVTDGGVREGGSFKTLRDSNKLVDPELNPKGLFNFSFEFACGNNQSPDGGIGASLPTYDTLNEKVRGKVDFAVLNGDWLYEEKREYPIEDWKKQVGLGGGALPHRLQVAPTMVGVWENYKLYLERGLNMAEWHKSVPSYFTYDDHEIINDVFGSGSAGFRNRLAVYRDPGVQAWFDYLAWANPTAHDAKIHFGKGQVKAGQKTLVDKNADFTRLPYKDMANLHMHWGGTVDYSIGRRSYGKFTVGNCDFFLLDTRSHRIVHDIKQPAKPSVSMLGVQQRRWLIEEMGKSDADFFFLFSSVNFMIPHVGGGGYVFDAATKDDAWTTFLFERELLIDFWDTLDQPVFVLSGDLHNSMAIKVTDNVWEFASGPHNSVNHRPEDEGMHPVNGMFKYGPRECEIRWSTTAFDDIPRLNRLFPHYCVVQINNVFNNPKDLGGERLVAYPHPQVIFQFYDGYTGELRYAESITTPMEADWKRRSREQIEARQ